MSELLALADRGAGVPLRELALVGLTAAITTFFCTGGVRMFATRVGAVAYPVSVMCICSRRRGWVGSACTSGSAPRYFWLRSYPR